MLSIDTCCVGGMLGVYSILTIAMELGAGLISEVKNLMFESRIVNGWRYKLALIIWASGLIIPLIWPLNPINETGPSNS